MKKAFIILVAFLLCAPSILKSQINHGVWYGQFDLRSNSLLLPICSNMISNGINGAIVGASSPFDYRSDKFSDYVLIYSQFTKYYKWFRINPAYDIHIPKWKLYDGDGEVATQGPDWWRCLLFGDFRHNYNFSLGYSVHYRSYDIPVGASVGVNYEWRGLCVKEGLLAGLHKSSGIVPSIKLSWFVLGNDFEREHRWNIVTETGVSYVKTLFYNDPLQLGKDKLNSGWRGLVALGFHINRSYRFDILLKYERDFYNFFALPQFDTRLSNFVIASFERMF